MRSVSSTAFPEGPLSATVTPRNYISKKSTSFGAALSGERIHVAVIGKVRATGTKLHTHPNEQFSFVLQGPGTLRNRWTDGGGAERQRHAHSAGDGSWRRRVSRRRRAHLRREGHEPWHERSADRRQGRRSGATGQDSIRAPVDRAGERCCSFASRICIRRAARASVHRRSARSLVLMMEILTGAGMLPSREPADGGAVPAAER